MLKIDKTKKKKDFIVDKWNHLGQKKPRTCNPRTLTPDIYPLDTYPLNTYPWTHAPYIRTLGYTPWTHTPWTYTPRTITLHNLKCLIWLMHHVLISYCTLENIYFAGIVFIKNVDAVNLSHICCEEGFSPHNCSGSRWALGCVVAGGKLCPFQMSVL